MTMKHQFIIRLTSSVVVFLVEIRMWTLIHKNIQLWNDFVLIAMLYELQALHHRIKACPNGKCLATKHHQTLFGGQTVYCSATLFGAV